ncbi:hypothetical protein HKX48_007948 [Thoreauomyces humboldtii]|nr:hypothetical protein HKX48_007948 [Thoreauomyces humboldtii]
MSSDPPPPRSLSTEFRNFGIPVGDTGALIKRISDQEGTIVSLRNRCEAAEVDKAKLLTANKVLRDHLALVCQLQDQLQATLKAYDDITARVQGHLKLTQQLHTIIDPLTDANDLSSYTLLAGAATPAVSITSTAGESSPGFDHMPVQSVYTPGAITPKSEKHSMDSQPAGSTTPSFGLSRREYIHSRRVSGNPRLTSAHSIPTIIGLLKMFPLFAGFPAEVLTKLAHSAYQMTREPGQVIITKGEMGAEIFFLETGDVHVMAAGPDGTGDDVPLAKLSDKSFFGELGVLFDKPRTANVQAFTHCFLYVLTKQKIQEAIAPFPQLRATVEEFAQAREKWWDAREYKISFGMEFIANIARQDITKLPVFADAPDQFLETLAQRVTSEVVDAGSLIISKGDDSDCIFFIIRGSAQVLGADDVVHADLGPGAFFGELGIILNIKRTANIRAKEQCFMLKLTKQSLEEVQESHPAIKKKIQDAVDERYALYQERCDALHKTPEQFHSEVVKQQLQKIPIFMDVDDKIIGELSLLMELTLWKSGDNIIQAGQRADSMFFLASGEVDVLSEYGEQIDKARGPDAWFGEVALLQDVPRTATVRAKTECSTFSLKKQDFMASLKKNPLIAERIEETARERLQAHLMRSILA